MTQLSLKEAKRLSIIKWEAHVKAGGYEPNLPKELAPLAASCGFCERWNNICSGCEFGKLAGRCASWDKSDLFSIWYNKPNIENAQSILNIIKSIPDE